MSSAPAQLVIPTRYSRSVHLVRDFANEQASLRDYHATPLVLQTVGRVAEGLQPDSTKRAFSIIGPYGSGKSALGVFLAHYLKNSPSIRRRLVTTHSTDGLPDTFTFDGPALLPILVSGNNESLRRALLRALQHMFETFTPLRDGRLRLPREIAAAAEEPNIDSQRVADLFAQASALLAERTAFRGIVLVIDELGQFLDNAARQTDERDLFVLQTLAEMAARSGATPVVIVTILHQAFDRYTSTAGIGRRTEWAKVQGRFVDLPFQEPPVQMLRLVGRALYPEQHDPFAQARQHWADTVVPTSKRLGLQPPEVRDDEWYELVARAYPLHPTVLVALPLLFRQLAQNERSLFAFLTSSEPFSVPDFLYSMRADTGELPIYRLSHLYAYIHATLGASLFGRARGQRWAELAEALALLPEPDGLLADVLATIGTLGALGQVRGMRASRGHIEFALQGHYSEAAVEQALSELETRKHITHRQHRDSFVIWEGSDLDLDGMIQEARREINDRASLVALLHQHATTTPLVARRHSYRTGSVRAFAVRYLDPQEFSFELPATREADGELLYLVPSDDEMLRDAQQWAVSPDRATELQRVVVLPRRVRELRDLLLDVAATQHVIAHRPELEYDRPARRELSSRLLEVEQVLIETIAATYGPSASRWFWRGEEVDVHAARHVDDLLSRVCDATYHATPRIWNELIMRRQISGSAAKARRNLIEAMLEHTDQERLGIEGYPPERAMYASILQNSGMHRQDAAGMWHFGPPPEANSLRLQPNWDAIQRFFDTTATEERPIRELFETLEAAPLGIKSGVIPILFMAVYIANIGEMALYEHGTYVPMPDIATFERMLRQTGNFAVRRSQISGARQAVYRHVAQALVPGLLERTPNPTVLDVVTPLLRLVRVVPLYSRTTRQISQQAQAVRKALLETRSPDELLFTDLPLACGLMPFLADVDTDTAMLDDFFAALRTSLQELQGAYAALIEHVREDIRAAFGAVASASSELHHELTQRYQHIAALGADVQVRSLGVRLESAGTGDAWIESIAALVSKKSLGTWNDDDARQFALQIKDWGRRFRTVEQMAVASQSIPSSGGSRSCRRALQYYTACKAVGCCRLFPRHLCLSAQYGLR